MEKEHNDIHTEEAEYQQHKEHQKRIRSISMGRMMMRSRRTSNKKKGEDEEDDQEEQ